MNSKIASFLLLIPFLAAYYLLPETKFYKTKMLPYVLLISSYLQFLFEEIPNLVQIIGLPSIFGGIAQIDNEGASLLALTLTGLIIFYLRVKSNSYLKQHKNFYKNTSFNEKHAKILWERFLYTSCMSFGFLSFWLVGFFRNPNFHFL
jgi:hypothetical protein